MSRNLKLIAAKYLMVPIWVFGSSRSDLLQNLSGSDLDWITCEIIKLFDDLYVQ